MPVQSYTGNQIEIEASGNSHDDGLCPFFVEMHLEKFVETAMHGPIVILPPAMGRQDKVSLWAVAIPLDDSDLLQGRIDLRVFLLPKGLNLQRLRRGKPGNFGDCELSPRLQESPSGRYNCLESHVVDCQFQADHIKFPHKTLHAGTSPEMAWLHGIPSCPGKPFPSSIFHLTQ